MKKDAAYHDFVCYDLMGNLTEISSCRMMGGWCIYSSNAPFAAIIGNQLYLKAKNELGEKLRSLGWLRFEYTKSSGKTVSMSYWLVPDALIDDQEQFNKIATEVIDSLK